jgi:hypothetical protein
MNVSDSYKHQAEEYQRALDLKKLGYLGRRRAASVVFGQQQQQQAIQSYLSVELLMLSAKSARVLGNELTLRRAFRV